MSAILQALWQNQLLSMGGASVYVPLSALYRLLQSYYEVGHSLAPR